MTSQALPSFQEAEKRLLDTMRARYEEEGFTFTSHPDADQVPTFLGSYVPDAVARKPGRNVAIEVKLRQNPSTTRTLSEIRRLFDGQSDWQLRVAYVGDGPDHSVTISSVEPSMIHRGADDVRALLAQGHRRSAFVMAWSALEAAFRVGGNGASDRLFSPGTVVQTLAMNGCIEPETESALRALIDLRSRIVHGDLVAEPTESDIEQVLSAIEEALGVKA